MSIKQRLSRVTSSARGEVFNPLMWPFLITTFAYGIGFTFFPHTESVENSSLFEAMTKVQGHFPLAWGVACLLTIIMGLTFLLYNIPPAGKVSGLIGFGLWVFAAFCWGLTGGWLLVAALALPNLWFWFWQYLSLSLFRREDAEDAATMKVYNAGGYDENPAGKTSREENRGVDRQSAGSYDDPDTGLDSSRPL